MVEDDADVRTYSCETLRELGYHVLEAETAAPGLQLLEAASRASACFSPTSACQAA